MKFISDGKIGLKYNIYVSKFVLNYGSVKCSLCYTR